MQKKNGEEFNKKFFIDQNVYFYVRNVLVSLEGFIIVSGTSDFCKGIVHFTLYYIPLFIYNKMTCNINSKYKCIICIINYTMNVNKLYSHKYMNNFRKGFRLG